MTLKRAMGFRDLIFFYLVTGFSLRWIAPAAAAGPSSVVIWIIGALVFYLPMMFTVLELSSRYPEEGGLYAWTRQAFGEFPGYLSGYCYWSSNLPYFPALFYFTAANALYMFGHRFDALQSSQPYFIIFSLIALAIAVGLNVIGLNIGKWLHNAGAIGLWVPGIILVVMGFMAASHFGSATPFTAHSFIPSTHLKDIIFWSTIAFSLSGLESASMLGDEIEDARKNIPRALLISCVLVVILNIAATIAMMLALPPKEIQNMQGFINSITMVATKLGIPWIASGIALLIMVGGLGQAGAWFAAAGRLPFVIGIRQAAAAGVRENSPEVGNASHRAARAGGLCCRVHLRGAGGNVGGRRVQRAREHVGDRVFHSVPADVRRDDQAARGAGRSGCHPRSRRQAGRDRVGVDRIRDHGDLDRARDASGR